MNRINKKKNKKNKKNIKKNVDTLVKSSFFKEEKKIIKKTPTIINCWSF